MKEKSKGLLQHPSHTINSFHPRRENLAGFLQDLFWICGKWPKPIFPWTF